MFVFNDSGEIFFGNNLDIFCRNLSMWIAEWRRMEFVLDGSLKEWAKDKPLSILQLDPADRAVLRIAGKT